MRASPVSVYLGFIINLESHRSGGSRERSSTPGHTPHTKHRLGHKLRGHLPANTREEKGHTTCRPRAGKIIPVYNTRPRAERDEPRPVTT